MWYSWPWSMQNVRKLRFCKNSIENSFFARNVSIKKLWKIRKLPAKDWMELKMHNNSTSRHWEAKYRILGRRTPIKWHSAYEKSVFSNIFDKSSPAKKFCRRKISATFNYDFANAAKWKTKVIYECICRKRASNMWNTVSGWDCRNCFEQKFKNKRFFSRRNRLKIVLAKLSKHATQFNGAPSSTAQTLAFLRWLWKQDSEVESSSLKSPSCDFSLNYLGKFWKSWIINLS